MPENVPGYWNSVTCNIPLFKQSVVWFWSIPLMTPPNNSLAWFGSTQRPAAFPISQCECNHPIFESKRV